MEDLFQKFKRQFINEIHGLLETLETDLLNAEKEPDNSELIDAIFRAMHTIKGTSAMYGVKNISDFTHHLESIFQNIRDTKSSIEKHVIDVSLASLDHIRNLLDDENLSKKANISKNAELLKEIEALTADQSTNQEPVEKTKATEKKQKSKTKSWYILLRTDEQIFFRGVNLVNILTDLSTLGTYHIHRIASLSTSEVETWGIIVITEANINDIKEVFMFIEDNCKFVLLKDGDLNDDDNIQKLTEKQAVEIVSQEKKLPEKQPNVQTQSTVAEPEDETEKESERRSVKSRTSMLVLESARHNLTRISVDSTKLDYLMYLVSELITLNSQMLQTTRDDYYEGIRPQVEQMESLVKLFRSNALEIRLVPLNDIIIKFQRLVRDLSKQLGKKIDFVTQNTDIELDKNTIDLIVEPIIHLVRNCVDHGIELPEARLKKGKQETGTVKLSAQHVGNFIQINIEDDGAGLDLDKIRKKAIQKGIIKASDKLTDTELSNLIFHSGFSTSENITDVSGRGVGMDVVRRKITELRGDVQIETRKDQGTKFMLKIQQSIAIVDTLLFKVESMYFILPLTDIEICIHTPKSYLLKKQNTNTIEYNEKMIPFFDLRSHFNLGGSYPDVIKTVIIKESGQHIGILADEILGEQQAVLKPLGQVLDYDSGIQAVSQHGDGKWAYMLNSHFLHQTLKQYKNQHSRI